ncbi:MAG: DNA polymerase III subunit beta [Deltaproteobacteria bacterium]|nr:DNA polymerase III subunit beta [Deltaproteobacteria bacterium]MBM4322612.1 DNA polymerase III subunit beta [Deltaproteobacteria bacterium]MBM4346806.1 DNA polymerase III subunit beta [Deltaproteobacteria bacterium]
MAHFEIDKKEFLKGLGLMQGIAGRKTTLPILSHIYMEWKKNLLFLTGTDLETGIQEELTATVHQEGKASISSKKLYEIIRELPEQTIHIQTKENHWIHLKCGKSVFNIAGLDPEEFPSLPAWQEKLFTPLPTRIIKEMIEKTVFAASNEDSRYHLNGIFLTQQKIDGKESLRMVATDGHRLSLVDREGQMIKGVEKGLVIPKKGVLEIKKILGEKEGEGETSMFVNNTHAFFKMGKTLMVIRLIEGEFPEYEQVIPKNNDKKLKVSKETLYGSLKRVSTMASERAEGVKLALRKNLMELSSYHQDFGDAKEEVDVQYEGSPIEIGFNARYLIEAIQSFDTDEILLEFKDEGNPGMIKPHPSPSPSNQICIIMPMRI